MRRTFGRIIRPNVRRIAERAGGAPSASAPRPLDAAVRERHGNRRCRAPRATSHRPASSAHRSARPDPMGLLVYLVVLAISGLIVGALARLALPGPDPMGIGMTILVGIAGSFIGG